MPFEELTDEPDRPWERPGAVRRDCEPHRAALIDSLGIVALVFGMFGFLVLPAILSLPLGICTWVMARRDLKEMRAGLMAPEGIRRTDEGRIFAIIGIGLATSYLLGVGALYIIGETLH